MAVFSEVSAAFREHPEQAISKPFLSMNEAQTFSVQVAQSIPSVEALRPIWKTWTNNLNTDIDYYLHNLKTDPSILHPYVITVCQDGIAQAMLVGQVRRRRVSAVISWVKVHGPRAKVLEVMAGGRVGRLSSGIDKRFALQLQDALRSTAVDLLCFQRLPLESDLFRELRQLPSLMKRRVADVFCYSVVPLAASGGKRSPALSGKNRREVRRKTKILQRAFPGNAQFRCFAGLSELDAGLQAAAAVDVTTWQHYMGYGLLNETQARERLTFCARQGWLRIYVMYVEDRPVAFLIGQHHQQTYYCQFTGYHPDFARYSVGSLLTAWVLENLAAAGVEQVDLGEGGQEHNRRLGCQVREEGTVHMYSLTLRGLCANLFFAAAQAVRTGGRSTREGLHLNGATGIWARFLLERRKVRQATPVNAEIRPAA